MDIYRKHIINYIKNSPHCERYLDWQSLPTDELLKIVGATIDIDMVEQNHKYHVIKVDSYEDAIKYYKYASDWCIMESDAAFYEHTHYGQSQFYFLVRDDIDSVHRAFGKTYPKDNYGLSMIAICIDKFNNIESVTSRWNFEENYDNYLSRDEIESLCQKQFEEIFPSRKPLRLLHISDTHGLHRELTALPEADVIIHSGDFSNHGTEDELFDLVNWFCDLPYKHKIFVAGNHDDVLAEAKLEGLDENCHYLNGNSVIIESIKFYGIPLFTEDQLNGYAEKMIKHIPVDTDVLITHDAPMGILDYADGVYYGSMCLMEMVNKVKPKFHLFGHIHGQTGVETVNGIIFSNGCLVSKEMIVHYPSVFTI